MPENSTNFIFNKPFDPDEGVEIVKKLLENDNELKRDSLALALAISESFIRNKILEEPKAVSKEDIRTVYFEIFRKVFDLYKNELLFRQTIGIDIDTKIDTQFNSEIFWKLLRATFQDDLPLESAPEVKWKLDSKTKKTVRYLIDLILYYCKSYDTEVINKFLDNFDTANFENLLINIKKEFQIFESGNNLQFLPLPIRIKALDLESGEFEAVSRFDTLHTRAGSNELILRYYTNKLPGGTNSDDENPDQEDLISARTHSNTPSGSLILLDGDFNRLKQLDEISDGDLGQIYSHFEKDKRAELIRLGSDNKLFETLFNFTNFPIEYLEIIMAYIQVKQNQESISNLINKFQQLKDRSEFIFANLPQNKLLRGFLIYSYLLPCIDSFYTQLEQILFKAVGINPLSKVKDENLIIQGLESISPPVLDPESISQNPKNHVTDSSTKNKRKVKPLIEKLKNYINPELFQKLAKFALNKALIKNFLILEPELFSSLNSQNPLFLDDRYSAISKIEDGFLKYIYQGPAISETWNLIEQIIKSDLLSQKYPLLNRLSELINNIKKYQIDNISQSEKLELVGIIYEYQITMIELIKSLSSELTSKGYQMTQIYNINSKQFIADMENLSRVNFERYSFHVSFTNILKLKPQINKDIKLSLSTVIGNFGMLDKIAQTVTEKALFEINLDIFNKPVINENPLLKVNCSPYLEGEILCIRISIISQTRDSSPRELAQYKEILRYDLAKNVFLGNLISTPPTNL